MFLFAADIHMSMRTFTSCPDATYDSIRSFEYLLKTASLLNCPIVLGGDIWDSNKVTPDVLRLAIHAITAYGSRVPIYYINGNHDSIRPSWTSFLPNTLAIEEDSSVVTLPDGTRIAGISACCATSVQEVADAISALPKDVDFLVCHQFIEKSNESAIRYSIPLDVFKDFKAVLAGDNHTPSMIQNDNTLCVYPGATNRRTIKETSGNYMLLDKYTTFADQKNLLFHGSVTTNLGNDYYFGNFFISPSPRQLMEVKVLDSEGNYYSVETGNVSDVVEQIYNTIKEQTDTLSQVEPYVVLYASGYDSKAIKELSKACEGKCHLLFRRVRTDSYAQSSEEILIPSGSRTASLQLSVDLIRSQNIDQDSKDICVNLLTNEEAFFAGARKTLGLE